MGKGRDKKRRDKLPKPQKESKKRHRNESSDSEDLDVIVETFKKVTETRSLPKPSTETVDSSDVMSRVNCAMQGSNEGILIFGGEWTDGSKTRFFGDLLRYNVSKDQWKVIRSGIAPTPRSSIQSVVVG